MNGRLLGKSWEGSTYSPTRSLLVLFRCAVLSPSCLPPSFALCSKLFPIFPLPFIPLIPGINQDVIPKVLGLTTCSGESGPLIDVNVCRLGLCVGGVYSMFLVSCPFISVTACSETPTAVGNCPRTTYVCHRRLCSE